MLLEIFGFLRLSFVDIVDIAVVALIIYVVFHWLRGSSAMNIFIAILFLFVIRIIAVGLNMKLLSALMGTVVDVGAIALVVIFQPEIRQFLGRVGRSGIARGGRSLTDRILHREGDALPPAAVKEVVAACAAMAEQKTGALIVIRHRNNLEDIIATGDRLDADIRERLLENIFFKDSPLHDGAVVLGGGRIVAARCTLPMTERTDLPARYGMRHKSAVGLTERSDADVIVVSEQRGTISFVHEGVIREGVNRYELRQLLGPSKE
ncbi:MAG: diadenylate cyclase CdaA [Bacteroidales bacterium]|nr:diadenylate cyclase CdaA [Bacteroidales bacterium]